MNALGTTIIIDINVKNDKNILSLLNEIEMLINNYNDKWSLYSDTSLVNKINNSKRFIEVDNDTIDIISESIIYSNKTNGYFDITTSKLNLIWKDTIKTKKLPNNNIIDKELKNIGCKKITINNNKIKLGKNQNIDLGGVAKGFILDKIISMLNESDIDSGVINLGGTIYVIGDYDIGVRNPFKPINSKLNDDYVLSVKLNNECIVTSGIYEQEIIIDGISYNHIINPKDGYPSKSNLISLSLISTNATMLDAYATAIFNMKLNDVLKLLKEENIDGIFIFKYGSIYVTDNIKDKVEMRKDNEDK